jgi:hypothetical protein
MSLRLITHKLYYYTMQYICVHCVTVYSILLSRLIEKLGYYYYLYLVVYIKNISTSFDNRNIL